jgi:hypothetical protein
VKQRFKVMVAEMAFSGETSLLSFSHVERFSGA